jgi:hypothetical protein
MKRLKTKIIKDKEFETFITFKHKLTEKQKNDLQNDLRKYDVRETYYLSSDKPKYRKEWFFKKSKER